MTWVSRPCSYNTVPTTPTDTPVSYKNLLQEHLQKQRLPLPLFRTEASEEGFVSTVTVKSSDGRSARYESSAHSSKKAAEQNAAAIACQLLNLIT